ncbi:RmlC-like cupin domain-containing protein [Jimgerdemannia flammicorona]|uniref:RmlC-like cupin domain-containing protein n=1 Tax=Jimgerdemannia flammicorona TaxID=994334 RepID=A0A433QTB6_9FUNG|nr:RmlC-like cupin domain-containing protein [Jimgerdemannia flammicorona]
MVSWFKEHTHQRSHHYLFPSRNLTSPMPTIQLRPSSARGHGRQNWLEAYHTFSFARYRDPQHNGFGALRVINEDVIAPGSGFGEHPHREMEIFTYIVEGAVEHQDSLSNTEILQRGDLQFTSSGKGIWHSESNASKDRNHGTPLKALQVWIRPSTSELEPAYYTEHFSDADKHNTLCHMISPVGQHAEGTVPINANAHVYAAIVEPGREVVHRVQGMEGKRRKVYVHVLMDGNTGAVRVEVEGGEEVLRGGDGAYVRGVEEGDEVRFKSTGEGRVEFLVFDLA